MAHAPLLFCDRCGTANRAQASFCAACGRPLRGVSTITISSTLTGLLNRQHMLKQRYLILGQAGKGGFGAVYKAADMQFGNRLVAVKEMSQNSLDTLELQAATEGFKREAMLLANLTHPNLPRIYDHFSEAGRWYLVMDFIEGETLEDHLNRLGGKKLPVASVLDITIQLCSVLEYLHTRRPPIIFRDLKPANVMLTPTDHVFLIDFGIARLFKPGQAKDTAALGSTGYASPEQYGRAQTTPRADIYGLGATLHQLLSGDDPSENPFTFAPLQLRNQPALSGLDTLVASMVSVDIGNRPASIALVKRELQRFATQHTTGQSNPLQYGTLFAYQTPSVQKTPRTTRKVPAVQAIRPLVNTKYICCGHASRITAVAWSPNGKLLASASFDKTVQLWDAASGQNTLTYKGHLDRVNAVTWSRDSKYIASASNDGTVQVWEAATGASIFTYSEHTGAVRTVVWSPDGTRIASAGDDKLVQVWDTYKTPQNMFTYQGHQNPVYALVWSPDSKRIVSGGEDKTVQVWEPTKVQPKRSFFSAFLNRGAIELQGHYGRINALAWAPGGRYIAAASSNYQILVWDVFSRKIIFPHRTSSTGMKNAVDWSPDGRFLASGCNDKTVQIWNILNKNISFTYRGHTGYVMAVAWSPDGTRIASAGVDHTVQVWQAV